MGTLCVMDRTGDTKTIWDKNKPEEVESARRQFDFLTKEKRYLAYTVEKDGSKGRVIRSFDPNSEAIICSPQLVGG